MTYEEKREVRLQISQLLADAGLNQGTIKEMVEAEIKNKVERAVDQVFKKLDAQSSTGNYVEEKIKNMLNSTYISSSAFSRVVKDELSNKIVQITLKEVEVE